MNRETSLPNHLCGFVFVRLRIVATQVAVAFFWFAFAFCARDSTPRVFVVVVTLTKNRRNQPKPITQRDRKKRTRSLKRSTNKTKSKKNVIPLQAAGEELVSQQTVPHIRYNKQNKHWINNEWLIDGAFLWDTFRLLSCARIRDANRVARLRVERCSSYCR